MRQSRTEKRVVIPARTTGSGLHYFYGGELPKLRIGAIVELIVPESAIEDKEFLNRLKACHQEELLPMGAVVYSAVAEDGVPKDLKNYALPLAKITKGYVSPVLASVFPAKLFVAVKLKKPLDMELRGSKFGRLKPVECEIPSLEIAARSLNHAYRLISEAYERERISHSGNVFEEMVYVDSRGAPAQLNELRETLESRNEETLRPAVKDTDTNA